MNKILRFAFVAAFAAVSSLSFAQKTVTFEAGKDKGTGLTVEKMVLLLLSAQVR